MTFLNIPILMQKLQGYRSLSRPCEVVSGQNFVRNGFLSFGNVLLIEDTNQPFAVFYAIKHTLALGLMNPYVAHAISDIMFYNPSLL